MALYLKRNECAVKLITSACIAVIEIIRSKIAPVSEVQLKKAMPNPTILYLLYLLHPLLPPSFSLWEIPYLRAPSNRNTEGYYFGCFVDFVV